MDIDLPKDVAKALESSLVSRANFQEVGFRQPGKFAGPTIATKNDNFWQTFGLPNNCWRNRISKRVLWYAWGN